MPPRKTTDFGSLFEALVEDLRLQVAAAIDNSLDGFDKRLVRLERQIEQIEPSSLGLSDAAHEKRSCALCARRSVARGLCSAHYQQWRYRERKGVAKTPDEEVNAGLLLNSHAVSPEVSAHN